ncbi:DNA-3-methyladenine glycosylase family protein [Spirosoma arcticum]
MIISSPIPLRFTGDYALEASVSLSATAAFVDALRPADGGPVLDLALLLEGAWKTVGVRIDQSDGEVRAHVFANPDEATSDDIRTQLERMLSLDIDGTGLAEVATRDTVFSDLRQRQPGIRPVLFPSPYEAAARAIIGHQLPVRQAAALNKRIAEAHGVRVDVGDHVMHGFPAPDRLAQLPLIRGLATRKVEQLRVLGTQAALLESSRLRAMTPDAAMTHLQQLPGIGPFSAELILMRGVGDPDAFPKTEKRLHRAMAAAYHLGDEPDLGTLERIADGWRPYRSWVGLLLRNTVSK